MGTASTTKFFKNNAGTTTEEAAVTTSAGVGDAQRIVALNASGVLDPTIVNAVNASAGAADAGKLAQLDSTGRLDTSILPTGVGADVALVTASEALSAGNLVNIWDNSGTANVRKADGTTSGKSVDGFVIAAVSNGATATVYFEGTNDQCSGLTPGKQFLSGATAGLPSATPASGAGKTLQRVGVATSATSMNFEASDPIVLA